MAGTPGARRLTFNSGPLWRWLDERLGLQDLAYPVPAHANNVLYTLGGITLLGVIVLIVTGIYLTQFYHAHPDDARESVEYIIDTARFGDFVRNLHFWLANLVMITLLLHAIRVFATGAYRAPRELNWVVGVGLLATFLGLVFTGTVLKWDQEGWEALQHNEEIGELLGGLGTWFTTEFTESTPILERLFVAHVAILPFVLVALAAVHFYLIKHHGISSIPGHEEARPAGTTDTATQTDDVYVDGATVSNRIVSAVEANAGAPGSLENLAFDGTAGWVLVPPEDPQKGGVFDVKSGAQGKASDGSEFSTW